MIIKKKDTLLFPHEHHSHEDRKSTKSASRPHRDDKGLYSYPG